MVLNVASSADNGMTVVLLVLCATVIMIMLLRRHQFRGTTRRDMARDHIARVRDQHQLLIGPWFHFASGGEGICTSSTRSTPMSPTEPK